MLQKKALITGITGQDGSYLAEFLIEKGYEVYGVIRRGSLPNTERVDHLFDDSEGARFFLTYTDLTDGGNLNRVIGKIKPDEIYNLAAQSHVGISFDVPKYTLETNTIGPLNILEAIRNLDYPVKFYQASSSEMFGKVLEIPQKETTPFNPQSPYGLSKVGAFFLTKMYRDGYDIFASNGILFNHESPRRGVNFVTRKITMALSRIKLGLQDVLRLGNLEASRDWGYSKDYVEGIWKILQHDKPDDFVIATGETHTVREFVEESAKFFEIEIEWQGSGLDEIGVDKNTGKVIIRIDPAYFRPCEVDLLIGNSNKINTELNWKPRTSFKELAHIMAESDFEYIKKIVSTGGPIVTQKKFSI